MDWVCLHDRERLADGGDGTLRCGRCRATYRVDGGAFIGVEEPLREDPLLDDLWRRLQSDTVDAAATGVCRRIGCSTSQITPDWKCFAPVVGGGHLLEIGGGFGEDTLEFAARAGQVVSLVPSLRHAQLLRRRLQESGTTNVEIAVVGDLTELPLPDGSIDSVVVEDLNGCGFDLTGDRLDATVAGWRRILTPGGTVFAGLSNPWDRRLGLRFLRAAHGPGNAPEPLNRRVRRGGAYGGSRRTLSRVVRSVDRQGFPPARVYAPLPGRDRIGLVLPVDDRRVVRYCFENLVRRNSIAVRSAIAVVHAAVGSGLFRHLLPFYFLVARLGAR